MWVCTEQLTWFEGLKSGLATSRSFSLSMKLKYKIQNYETTDMLHYAYALYQNCPTNVYHLANASLFPPGKTRTGSWLISHNLYVWNKAKRCDTVMSFYVRSEYTYPPPPPPPIPCASSWSGSYTIYNKSIFRETMFLYTVFAGV